MKPAEVIILCISFLISGYFIGRELDKRDQQEIIVKKGYGQILSNKEFAWNDEVTTETIVVVKKSK